MKKSVIVLAIAILALLSLAFLADNVDQAQAQENHVWFLPIMHKNYMPNMYGCLEPDPANCSGGPPFHDPNMP
jgi:hypothetical protein